MSKSESTKFRETIKEEGKTTNLNEAFYSDLEDLYFLLNNAEELRLTDKEIQIVNDQIKRKVNDAVKVDAISFLGEIYERRPYVLENCLPAALKEDNRNKPGIPEENKENLIELITHFRTMTLKDKIRYLEEPRNWGIVERNGYVYGCLSQKSGLDLEDVDDELEYNPLYSALTLLDRIIDERELITTKDTNTEYQVRLGPLFPPSNYNYKERKRLREIAQSIMEGNYPNRQGIEPGE